MPGSAESMALGKAAPQWGQHGLQTCCASFLDTLTEPAPRERRHDGDQVTQSAAAAATYSPHGSVIPSPERRAEKGREREEWHEKH